MYLDVARRPLRLREDEVPCRSRQGKLILAQHHYRRGLEDRVEAALDPPGRPTAAHLIRSETDIQPSVVQRPVPAVLVASAKPFELVRWEAVEAKKYVLRIADRPTSCADVREPPLGALESLLQHIRGRRSRQAADRSTGNRRPDDDHKVQR